MPSNGFWSKYKSPTPAKWRKIGDTLLLVGASLTEYLIAHDSIAMAQVALLCTVLGKVITNFATE